jgi:hypothetical protein
MTKPRARMFFVSILIAVALGATTARAEDGPGMAPPFPDPEVRGWQVGILRPDRMQHGTLAFTAGSLVGLPCRSPGAALISSASLALGKELWDARQGRFDVVDLTASLLGGLTAAAITHTLTR